MKKNTNAINSIADVYQTLLEQEIPVYQTAPDCIALDTGEYTVQTSAHAEQPTKAVIIILCEGREYCYRIGSFADACTFLLWLSQGRICITKTADFPRVLTVKNWFGLLREQAAEKKSPLGCVKRIIGTLFGVILTILSLLITFETSSAAEHTDFTFLTFLDEISIDILLLTGTVLGISLIKHVNSKHPIDSFSVVMYIIGVCMTNFFTSLILGIWALKNTEPIVPIYGICALTFCFLIFVVAGIGLIVSALKDERSPSQQEENRDLCIVRKPILPPEEQMIQLMEEISSRTRQECIALRFDLDRKPSLTDSKIGGVPYWDLSKPFPMTHDGHKLLLLAQINLSQLPENTMLPKEGILQFFIDNDASLGMDEPNGHQVIFHKTIDPSVTEETIQSLGIVATVLEHFGEETEGMNFPVSGEFAVSFEKIISELTINDYRADTLLHTIAEELGITLEEYLTYSEFCEWFGITEDRYVTDDQMFGYCNYVDPRTYADNSAQYDTLLFKLDSHAFIRHPNCFIEWYDSGSGYFFISHEKLAALDFKDVFYTWEQY